VGPFSEAEIADNMYEFLQKFFDAHPKYRKNGFYITGESYAGHYVPAISARIVRANLAKEGPIINLQASAIGNGLVDPASQYAQYPDFAYQHGLVNADEYAIMAAAAPVCVALIESCEVNDTIGWTACIEAFATCNTAELLPIQFSGVNVYDIRLQCGDSPLCYNFTLVDSLMSQEYVQKALGVQGVWVDCNPLVNLKLVFGGDWMQNFAVDVPLLLSNNVSVLVYSGEYDYICNWYGGSAWTHALDWSGHDAFNAATNQTWHVSGAAAGTSISAMNFTFLRVRDAGHMVPLDQPQNALSMLQTFLANQPFV